MKTWNYDLGHYSFQAGAIGGLMTCSMIPIVAGDRMEIDWTGIWRLSPLRRQLTVDAKVDLFAFYIPYRHIYGDDWINFIKEGLDEAVTFTGVSLPTGENPVYGFPLTGSAPLRS